MKKYDVECCPVLENTQLTEDAFSVWLLAPSMAAQAVPGQFVHVYTPGKTLRRPISLCEIDKERGAVRLVFQSKGEGTAILAKARPGDSWDVLGPLGNGFTFPDNTLPAAFVGGGIGTPPMLAAAKAYGKNAVVVTGFRNSSAVILQQEFSQLGVPVHLVTDDGTAGCKGFVTDVLKELGVKVIYACGPSPMLKAVSAVAAAKNAQCWLSLEERMACGVGACLGCAVKLHGPSGDYFGHVCKGGPVFPAESLVWE